MIDTEFYDDYTYIMSALGNAYFSGLTFDQLWVCIETSTNKEELDRTINMSIEVLKPWRK